METNLKKLYAEICRCHSADFWQNKRVYIKHLSHFDLVDIDFYYEEALELAKMKGIKTFKERLEWLKNKKLWSDKDDSDILQQKIYVDGLEQTKKQLVFKSQIESHNKTLEIEKKKYNEMVERKNLLIGLTAERSAEQKIQYKYIYLSFYKDQEMKNKLFTEKDIYDMSDDESYSIMNLYCNVVSQFEELNIKKIALSPFFMNYFFICGDNIASFFNKPIAELSFYQFHLISYGMHYKNILMNNPSIPDNIKEDPIKLDEFVIKSKNLKNIIEKTGSSERVGLVVGNSEDLTDLGIKDGSSEIRKVASKENKTSAESFTAFNK